MYINKFILNVGLFFIVHSWSGLTKAKGIEDNRPDDISDNQWSSLKFAMQDEKLLPTPLGVDAAGDNFGISVSLSGYRALIGASLDDDAGVDSGAAYVFDYDGSSWSLSQKLVANDGAADDRFGFSVSLSGGRALIGSHLDEHTTFQNTYTNSGTAYIFDYDAATNSWLQTQKLNPNDFSGFDEFGISVSLSGDRALIGAYKNRDAGFGTGSAYIFDYNGSSWSQSQKLIASDGASNDLFGYSVSLSGDRALIGSHHDDAAGSKSGSAYVFDYNGSSWSQSQKLTAGDGAAQDWFGYAVSLSGDRALIGARYDDDGGINSGSAYIFDYNGSNWSQSQKLTADIATDYDLFGYAVSLSGDRALVGAYQDDDMGTNSGSAYIFEYVGSNWSQSQKLTADDGSENDSFGYSVSQSGNRALIGAFHTDDRGTDSGSAYAIKIEDTFEVSVNVSGLVAGNSVEILNNGGDNVLVSTNGAAVFPTALIDNTAFSVTVNSQPTSPNQICTVNGGNSGQNDGTGQIAGANSIGINVMCSFVYYVDMNASAGGDGFSWHTALNNLQDALNVAVSNHEIWVAQGVYYPDVGENQVNDDKLASFTLIDGVSVYGGFDGTEIDLNQRDPKMNVTVLSGDITQDDANADGNNILEDRLDIVGLNSFHIVTGSGVNTSTVFSGFIVTAGQADGVVGSDERHGAGMYCGFGFNGPRINQSTFIGNYAAYDGAATYGCSQDVSDSEFINNYSRNGGAVFIRGGDYENVLFQGNTTYGLGGAISKNASPLNIVNSKFISNHAIGNGGAIHSINGVTLKNILFSGNKSNSSGGAIHQSGSSSVLTNLTMTGNLAAGSGGAISLTNSVTLNLRNSIIWNNHDSTTDTTVSSSINVNGGAYSQTNSLVQNFGTSGAGNLDEDPLFIIDTDPSAAPTNLGNAHLNNGSPAINMGDNSFATSLTTDLDGNTRIQDTTVDMGAYEFSRNTVAVNVSGLGAGSLVLQNNGTDDITFNNNGTLVFSLPIVYSGEYSVTILSQPTAPNQECIVSNATGVINGLNVLVTVVCTTNQHSVGGTISGLINGTLILQNNAGNDIQLTTNGTFEFTNQIDELSSYAVTVKTNPSMPEQTCIVTGGSSGQNDGTGQLADSDYTGIIVTCSINQYSIGGTLSGLKNGTLTLQNNHDNDLQLSNNGAFEFPIQLDDLSGYTVTVKTSPSMPTQDCLITGGNSGQNDGSGNLAGDNYAGIDVTCTSLYYVDMNAPNMGNGYSWATAFNNLQDALAIVYPGDSIWVAQGVYYPDVGGGQVDDDRSASFLLRDSVSIYGGFDGTETLLNQRNPEINVTILSGDIGQDDGNLDGNNILEDSFSAVGSNSYQVIKGTGVNDNSTRFSGFTVTAGKADAATFLKQRGAGMDCGSGFNGPSISESTFIGNYAFSHGGATFGCAHDVRDSKIINNFSRLSGAVKIIGGYYENVLFEGNFSAGNGGAMSHTFDTLTIVNSEFIANRANAGGGALHSISGFDIESRIVLENILFSGNASSSAGGGMLLEGNILGSLDASLTNVTLTGNIASTGGAISLNSSAELHLRNSIIWNNFGTNDAFGILGEPSIDLNSGNYTQTNSLVEGFGTVGTGNLDEDPLFILDTNPLTAPTSLGNAHLQVGSPAINTGDNSFVSPLETDLDGNARIQDTTVDMGAYEFSSQTVSVTVSGLDGGTLVLQNNGGDDLTFSTDGTLAFNTSVANTADYLVTVFSQPTSPTQECIVTEPMGTINDSNVTVNVNCEALYNVGVDVSGLANGVTLGVMNNSETLNLMSNGPINFATAILDGESYDVTVTTNPSNPNQECLVTSNNASGSIDGMNVIVTIECSTLQYNVGVDVFALAGGTTLSVLNNSESMDLSSNGTSNFPTALDDGSAYAVSVATNPESPNQTCLVTSNNASGFISGGDIEVTIQCNIIQYNVSVDVTGLAGGNTLALDNSGEALTVSSNGLSEFASGLDDLSEYTVTITSQPTSPNQTCEITSGNQTGAISGSDEFVSVACITNSYFIGGFINGLLDNNLMMIGNNSEELIVSSEGAFVFLTPIPDEESYDVQILLQPEDPIQPCTLLNSSGDLNGSDIIDIEINCEVGDDLIYKGGFEETTLLLKSD